MDSNGIEQMLSQMRAAQALASGKTASASTGTTTAEGADFASVLKSSIDQVNQAQNEGKVMAQNFSAEDPNANLQEVMIALQKANLSFQEMVQVRNRLVTAYQDVMNIQV